MKEYLERGELSPLPATVVSAYPWDVVDEAPLALRVLLGLAPVQRWRGAQSASAVTCALLALACTSEVTPSGAPEASTGSVSASAVGGVPEASGGAGAASGTTSVDTTTTAGTPTATVTGGSGGSQAVPEFEPHPGLLKRLTRAQFRNAIQDLMGVEVDVTELEPDSFNGEFAAVGAATVVTSERGVEQYHTAVESAVDQVFADPVRWAEFVGCTPALVNDSCVRGFVESMGRLAWRRSLETAEIDRLMGVAETAATQLEDVNLGVRWATVALFASPHFLYRPELGAQDSSGAYRFTSHELASKLAFLLWNTVPDAQLLDEADSGALISPEGLRSAAERMLDAPAGRRAIGAFAEDYMRLDRVLTQAKDAALFPEYGPALQDAMVRDVREVWEIIAYDNDGSALDIFSTTTVVANAELAVLYGLDASGLDSNTFRAFELPATGPRLGLLSKAGFLSQFANQKEGSPTLRGKFIREALMCDPVDPPPGNVALELPEPPDDAPMTKRQRLEAHRAVAACAVCHNLMDPMGLPLENFDAIGRFRTTDHGLAIDPTGEFDEQPVADARELGIAMSTSDTVAACLARKYYAYAVGYEERDVDASVVQALAASFKVSGYRFRSLILDVVLSEAFVSVTPQL